ncbi:MAG: CbtB-domain containing protein [Streptosporangiales bacterium]|nr:CbtB-domain containing protein [Streptosporangiales bacterium]
MAQSATVTATHPNPAAPKLPFRAILPWAALFGLLLVILLYFVGAEQGATSMLSGEGVHEWLHDGRHLLGFPCH